MVKADLALDSTLKSQPPTMKGKADAAVRFTNDRSFEFGRLSQHVSSCVSCFPDFVLPKSGSVRFITLYLRTPNSTSGQVQARWPNPGPDAFERVRKGSVQVQNAFEPSNR
ncbi:hypothetical protein BDR06DRAFT_1011326 [Suillus hirtellus]|nr:hypothetical protein BDR06DRAFT_1011326 [Suillus hirtellus]